MAPRVSVITPAVVVPSPQLIVALKSLATLLLFLSVKVATFLLKAWPALALKVMPFELSTSASAATTVPLNDKLVLFAVSVIVTPSGKLPSPA
jgi:hypothetical protein